MEKQYFLAVDIGASSGRHILAHLEGGKMVTEEIYRFPNGAVTDGAGRLVWDTQRLFAEIVRGLQRAKEVGKIPYSVAVDTWGVDYVLLDEHDELIDCAYAYRDVRTEASSKKVHEILPFAALYEKTGIGYNVFNSVYQLYADKLSGKLDKAASLLMLPDYFHFRLTGVKKQEYTNATTTGMVNAKTHVWDEEILTALGLNKALFGALTQPGAYVGAFSDEIEKAVGYKAKVFMPATHDTASAVLAAPLTDATPYISSGTWSLLGVEQPFAHTDEHARLAGYSNEGSVQGQFRLQKNIMGLWMIQQVRHETGDAYSFAQLADMARNNPVDIVLDVNDGRFLAPENMTREICAAAGRDLTLGEIAYVIFDNLARDYQLSLEALERVTGKQYATLNIIGGGSQNVLLNELTAKRTSKQIITGPTECTAIGNFMMQMVGAGVLSGVQEGRQKIADSFAIDKL